MSKRIACVMDADYLVFSAMSAAEEEHHWGDDVWSLLCDHAVARRIFDNKVEDLMKRVVKRYPKGTEFKIVMCFTDDVNWRKEVLPTYKMNRKGTRKPVGYKAFVKSIMDDPESNSFLRPTLEGDDCMGIIGTCPKLVDCDEAVLFSCDKDFKTIPDCTFFWMTEHKFLEHDLAEADYWHMYQTLIGDTTDGYGGVPGIGSDTAHAFLKEPYFWRKEERELKTGKNKGQMKTEWKQYPIEDGMTLWDCMVTLAAKAGMSEDELLVQARVARILRISDFDLKKKEVILWSPIK